MPDHTHNWFIVGFTQFCACGEVAPCSYARVVLPDMTREDIAAVSAEALWVTSDGGTFVMSFEGLKVIVREKRTDPILSLAEARAILGSAIWEDN